MVRSWARRDRAAAAAKAARGAGARGASTAVATRWARNGNDRDREADTMNRSTRGVFAGLVLSALLAACTTDPCARSSPCPNDTPPTQAQRDQCRTQLQSYTNQQCYSEAVALVNCQLDNIACGTDGHTDATATQTRVQNNCRDQTANVTSCCIRNPTSTVCM
jgi:hypothetical protein